MLIAHLLILTVIPALLITAAGWDLVRYTIPNRLSLLLLAAFIASAALAGMPLQTIGLHLLVATGGLVIGFTLFAFGWIGGGDAKLFAATALIMGTGVAIPYALLSSILGGGLTLALLSLRTMPLPLFLTSQQWISRLHDSAEGVPYGIALAVAALILLPHTDIYHLAGA